MLLFIWSIVHGIINLFGYCALMGMALQLSLPHFRYNLKIGQYSNIVWLKQAFGGLGVGPIKYSPQMKNVMFLEGNIAHK